MDLKNELENELAVAILIEKRHKREIDADSSRELRAERFHRDASAMLQVFGEIDHSHPTAPQLPLDLVAIGEGGG